MKKTLPLTLSGLIAATLWLPITSVSQAAGNSIEQRVERLERMTENPVLLQLSRRLGEQQREIQQLHDSIDRLKRDLRISENRANQRYKETDDRLSTLEGSAGVVVNKSSFSSEFSQLEQTARTPQAAEESEYNVVQDESLSSDSAADSRMLSEYDNQDDVEPSLNTRLEDEMSGTQQQEVQTTQSTVKNRSAKPTLQPIKTSPATALEKAEYEKAFLQMKSAQYANATTAFEKFIADYPNSDLASNAAYWAGEGHLINKNNKVALDSFMIVLDRYPDSPKVADAQLRAADSLANLKRIDEAKKMYQDVINNRPHSLAAKTASKRLNGLK